jgi:VanZ family protein
MAAVIFVGAEPSAQPLVILPPWDKVVHFFYYGTMAFLLAFAAGRRWLIVPLLLVPVIGALDEWHQAGIPGRDASFFDWVADELGTLAFVYAYVKLGARFGAAATQR